MMREISVKRSTESCRRMLPPRLAVWQVRSSLTCWKSTWSLANGTGYRNSIEVVNFQIAAILYSDSFRASVEAAVRAKNEAVAAENTVNRIQFEAASSRSEHFSRKYSERRRPDTSNSAVGTGIALFPRR